MNRKQWQEWRPGDPVLINRIVWDQAELDQVQSVFNNDWFGPGEKVDELAKSLANFTTIDLVQPVNSGSSALTLAVEAMVHLGHWKPGDWILHPVLTFPTSINPAIKNGLIPVFVDVEIGTCQIDLSQAEAAMMQYGNRIKGAIIPHLLGNVCNLDWLMDTLDGRPLVEDCCDTLGTTWGSHVGNFGEVAAFSFYGSHHATTGGVGGALATNRQDIYDYAKSATHWGRNDYDQFSEAYELFEHRYTYDTLGHDYQMTELQAAFGVAQLERVTAANVRRKEVFREIDSYFRLNGLDKFLHLPYCHPKASPSWFAYQITIRDEAPFSRRNLAEHLISNLIEIRPIFTGNITKHPAYRRLGAGSIKVFGSTDNADLIDRNGLFIPSWGMSEGELAYMLEVLDNFFKGFRRSKVKCHQ